MAGYIGNPISGGGGTSFDSGTAMLFQQTSAPTGWTKATTHDDKALRVVNGTVGTGGTTAFSTAFGTPSVTGSVSLSGSTDGFSMTNTYNGSHSHTSYGANNGVYAQSGSSAWGSTNLNVGKTTSSSGGGTAHSHGLSGVTGSLSSATAAVNVNYVDVIIATKD